MKCFECGQPAEYQYHIVPKSLGKKKVPLCMECNEKVRKYCINQEFYETALSLQELLKKYEPGYNSHKEATDQEINENIRRLQEILGKYE